ncbi:MAG: hypothetical protein ACLRZN_05020 [Dialister invisus]
MTNRLGIESEIESDCAPLNHMVEELLEEIYLSIPFGILRGADLPLWQMNWPCLHRCG